MFFNHVDKKKVETVLKGYVHPNLCSHLVHQKLHSFHNMDSETNETIMKLKKTWYAVGPNE